MAHSGRPSPHGNHESRGTPERGGRDPRLLFTPLVLRGVEVRNRILMTGAQTGMATGGYASDQLAAYYGARARGGAGLIVTEITIVHPSGFIAEHAIRNWDDSAIAG